VRAWAQASLDAWSAKLTPEWDVAVEWDLPTEGLAGARASCRYGPDDFVARLRFAEDWAAWSRDEFEQVLVHELLHLVLRDVEWIVRGLAADHVDELAHAVLSSAQGHEIERVIWRLSTVLHGLAHRPASSPSPFVPA